MYQSYRIGDIHVPLCHYAFVHVDSNFAGSKMFYCIECIRMDEVVLRVFLCVLYMCTWM